MGEDPLRPFGPPRPTSLRSWGRKRHHCFSPRRGEYPEGGRGDLLETRPPVLPPQGGVTPKGEGARRWRTALVLPGRYSLLGA
jgi:hypothetical protein